LCREFLFYPVQSLSRSVGSGLCVAREPRLPRTHGGASRRSHPIQFHAGHSRCQGNESLVVLCWMTSMRTIRQRLSSLLTVMLAFQLGGLIAPVALSAAGASVIEACTCPGGTHATTCPMHHGKDSGSATRANRCTIRSASLPGDLALLTLGTGAGILPSLNSFDVADEPSTILPEPVSSVRPRADFPDSPPPRR
jgi:hypothetical protein